jgi:hypothetical protein
MYLFAVAWMGMISFFIFAAFAALTGADLAVILMIAAMLVWAISGITIIYIKRT